MLQAKCIQKFRDNKDHIYGYRLIDMQGNIKDINSDKLKRAIKNNNITVLNLTLTTDNRLVDKVITEQQTSEIQNRVTDEQKIKNLIAKARLLGSYNEIPTYCGHKCQLATISSTSHIIYIPDDVIQLNDNDNLKFTANIQKLRGNIKIYGGKCLEDSNNMFANCIIESLDLTDFYTSNIRNMEYMFYDSNIKSLDLSYFDTSNVEDMQGMFDRCNVPFLDLSSFDTRKAKNMKLMFYHCKAKSIDLLSFDTSGVNCMDYMFNMCKSKIIAQDKGILAIVSPVKI